MLAIQEPKVGIRVALVRPLINSERNVPFFLPLGLLCVSAALKRAGHAVRLLDFEYQHRITSSAPPTDYLHQQSIAILSEHPELVGVTVLADTLPHGLLLCQHLKQLDQGLTTVLGGPGVFGMLSELATRFGKDVDYFCVNEGEIPMVRLADALAEGRKSDVPGMCWHNGNDVRWGPPCVTDLDELPPPDYDLLPVADYLDVASPRIFDLYVGTGCTYACSFCTTAPFWDRTFRVKSPSRILSELTHLHQRYGITRVNFLHDNFANKKAYLDGFLDYFTAHNTQFEWACAVRQTI